MSLVMNRRSFVQAAGAAAGIAAIGRSAHATESLFQASATVPGFGGDVSVSFAVDTATGTVSNVAIDAIHETPDRGGAAAVRMQAAMETAGSVEVDTVASATVTSTAILDAARHALHEALGSLDTSGTMAPGTYRSASYGFYPGLPVTVEVTVSENAIEAVEIVDENLETIPMLRAVNELYIPRVIENQSLSVDAVAGASMTSSAVRLAVESCVKQAFDAAGAGQDAFYAWLRPASYPTEDTIVIEKDVVVVGLGGSGIAAALSSAERGLSVIAIDTAGKYGGTICVTSESFAVNPPMLKEELNDGKDWVPANEFEEDWWARTNGDAKRAMLDLFFAESGNTIDWLNYDHGFPYNAPNPGHADYAVYDCCHTYDPYTLSGRKQELSNHIDLLMEQYATHGGETLLEVEATGFIIDELGAVVGVKARGKGGQEYELRGKAVVVATGGFGGNLALMNQYMVDDYYPLSGTWHLYGMATNTGKMIQAALEMGAGTCNPSVPPLSHLAGFPVNLIGFGTHKKDEESFFTGYTAIWSEGDIPTSLCVAADALAVNRRGERFINEEGFATHQAIKAGPEYYTIWSQEQIDTFREQGFSYADPGPSMGYCGCQSTIPVGEPLPQIDAVMQAGIDAGYIFKADSIAELAVLSGMDPDSLVSTVDAYNACCEAGVDADFGKDPQWLVKVGGGPYYAVLGCSFYYTTGGALDINEDLQVLDTDGNPITGLYAVGTDSMGVLMTNREQYLDYGGAASGWAFTSGRLVGKVLATKLPG